MGENSESTPTGGGKENPGRRRVIGATLSYSLLVVFLLTGLAGPIRFPQAGDGPWGLYALWAGLAFLAVGAVAVIRHPFWLLRIGMLNAKKFANRTNPNTAVFAGILVVACFAFSFGMFINGAALFANAWIGEQQRLEFPCTVRFIDQDSSSFFGGGRVVCRDDGEREWEIRIIKDENVEQLKRTYQKGDRVDIRVYRGSLGIHYVWGWRIPLRGKE